MDYVSWPRTADEGSGMLGQWRESIRGRFRAALEPELDDTLRTGLSLIDLLFGLALGLAFAQTLNGYGKISAAGWAQLALAVVTIVLSWVGYHNTRQRGLWMMKFVNRPFVQYLIDFLITATYWALVVTAEGIPPVAGKETHDALYQPSPVPETLLLFIVFILYFFWDRLEISINEDACYKKKRDEGMKDKPKELAQIVRIHEGDQPRAKMTELFLAIFGIILATVWGINPTESVVVAWIDVLLIGLLVAYRLAQTWRAASAAGAAGNVPPES